MADDKRVKQPPHVGRAPGSTAPSADPAKVDEESLRQFMDRYLSPTDKEYTAPEWMSRMVAKNCNHFFAPEGDIEIRFQPYISDDPKPSTLVHVKGLENPEEAIHFFYDFARCLYLFGRDEKGFSPSESLSYNWLKCAKSYAGHSDHNHPFSNVGPITLQHALDRINYQMGYGCGLVTLDATLAHLWAYWERRAEDAASEAEKTWNTSIANQMQFIIKLMSYGNYNDPMSILFATVSDCCQKWDEEKKDPQLIEELPVVTVLHSLVSAEICYRHAACAMENAVRRGHILKAERHITAASLTGGSISNTVWTYASNLYGLMKEGLVASPFTGSCAPVGINVPGYGPTAASLSLLHSGVFLVRPLTPIV